MRSTSFLFVTITVLSQVCELFTQNQQDVISAINFATFTSHFSETLERIIANSGEASIDKNTPTYKQYISFYPSAQLSNAQRNIDAIVNVKASAYLMAKNLNCSGTLECVEHISKLELKDIPLGNSCVQEYSVTCQSDAKYRNIDGSCYNLERPAEGKAITAFKRILSPPRYTDGIFHMIPDPQLSNRALPYARVVSEKLSQDDESEENNATLITMQWAQFIANDIAQTPISNTLWTNEPINCCDDNGGNLAPRYLHPSCVKIHVPENDPVYGPKRIRCLNYVRSLPAINPTCNLGSMQQMNQVTHYLDASTIYGSTEEKSQKLREMKAGRLRVNFKDGREYLPDNDSEYASECEGTCYAAGDDRVNEHPQLAALHTIWLREHNRIARALESANADWTDEELYQETRRRVIAEVQHITYHEWLPMHFGERSSELLNNQGTHDSSVTATVNNEVANAVLHYFYTLMQQNIKLLDESHQVQETIRLADYYYKPRIIESDNVLDNLLRGLTVQPSKKYDINLVSDLTSKLYANDGNLGLDILSFDIQRGRDHGFMGYLKYRETCENDTITTFDELVSKNIMTQEVVDKLKQVYRNPSEIDLIVGGLAEIPKTYEVISDTFMCLLIEQFHRTRYGDRYFYDNPNQPHPFSKEQLNELQKVTLARIICDNADNITRIQPHVFFKPEERNQLVPCSEIPSPNII